MAENKHEEAAGLKPLLRIYAATLIDALSWKVALALLLMICAGLMEGVGLTLLIPLLQSVGLDVEQGAMGRIASFISSGFAAVGLRPTLVTVLCLYVFVVSTQAVLVRWQSAMNYTLLYEFVAVLRRRLYQSVTGATWLFFSRSRPSDFTHALTSELDRVATATYSLLFLASNFLVTLAYVLLAIQLSPALTGLAFASGAGLMLLLKAKTRASGMTGRELTEATNELYAATTEHLGGMKTVKSYGAEHRNSVIFSRLVRRVTDAVIGAVGHQADAAFWFSIGSVVTLSLILYVSVEILNLSTATILLLLFLFARIMPRFSSLQQNLQQFLNDLPAFANVIETEARCRAAAEPEVECVEPVPFQSAIELERVSFAYEQSRGTTLSSIDLLIEARSTTAIVGPSGAGKSTIADLIIGLIKPDGGRVLVDGAPLTDERMAGWRNQIGYVAQDTFLFHDSIRANLLWARPGANDEEVNEALRLAAATDFVAQLPEGDETVIGDRGVRLSGGERQRLALARALLRKPSLLILDEATSALDSENERRIQSAIDELHGNLTILVITHRLSTIRNADVIYVIEQGSVVESGSWGALAAKENGRFQSLCRAQSVFGAEPEPSFKAPLTRTN